MSVTAFDNEAASKSLEDAGFTDVQIAALMGCMRQPVVSGGRTPSEDAAAPSRKVDTDRGGSLAHALAMLVLALGGLGALLAILLRVT
jgi:hypothetical protein